MNAAKLNDYLNLCPLFNTPKKWKLKDVAEYLGVPKHYFYNLRRSADMPGRKTQEKIVLRLREAYRDPSIGIDDVFPIVEQKRR
jgi:hypothetical protein